MKKQKVIIRIILVVFTIALFFMLLIWLTLSSLDFPGPDDIPLEKEIATTLAIDLRAYHKINQMDDCQRSKKFINGVLVRMNKTGIDNEDGRYYKAVLVEEGIDESAFENFKIRLKNTKLRSYYRTEKYAVFIVDGFLDSVWGYLYNHSTKKVSQDYFKVGRHHNIRIVEDLGDQWYRFGTF